MPTPSTATPWIGNSCLSLMKNHSSRFCRFLDESPEQTEEYFCKVREVTIIDASSTVCVTISTTFDLEG